MLARYCVIVELILFAIKLVCFPLEFLYEIQYTIIAQQSKARKRYGFCVLHFNTLYSLPIRFIW